MNPAIRTILAVLCALFATQVWAQPALTGYSVNSDEPLGDRLHRIDLSTGAAVEIGVVQSLGTTRLDVEGLAFAPGGELWGIDDQSLTLFPIGLGNAQVDFTREAPVSGLSGFGGNDFGMTFACDGTLYISSVADQTLFRLALDGTATAIGSLGTRISALAAYGNPTRLYGLGNGLLGTGQQDNRSLYEIDPLTGAATLVGPLGAAADDYFQAGLSFDDSGQLWALTDRYTDANPLGNEILLLDLATGAATLQATTSVAGFESLAVAPPAACDGRTPPDPVPAQAVGIPTLSTAGRIAATLLLLLAGLTFLSRRSAV